MKIRYLLSVLGALAALLLAWGLGQGTLQAQPPFHIFQGTATLDGAAASGEAVQALVGGTVCASTTTDSAGAYLLEVPIAGLSSSPPGTPDECAAGASLTFTVGGVLATETATLQVGGFDAGFALTAATPPPCTWSAAALTGWNNLAFLGANSTPIADAIAPACLVLPPGGSVRALWHWDGASQRWSRNLYFPDGSSSIQIMAVNTGETFWILVGP